MVVAGCSSSGSTPATSAQPSTPAGAANQLYVSIGDSYAAGFQPTGKGVGHTTRNGFSYQLVGAAKAKGYDLRLVNLGCGGATTASLLNEIGCKAENLGPGAVPYDATTQIAAAQKVLRDNRGKVALVTVSIGGNDVTSCAAVKDPVPCVAGAVTQVKANLATILTGLRAAAGPDVQIVGITYPDVILGEYLSADTAQRDVAKLSVTAFKALLNPVLKAGYAAVGGSFVDVTAATGAYGSLDQTTNLPPYGTIPVPVAKVCELTFFCQYQDIHPRTAGYTLISNLVEAALPARRA